MRFRKIRNKFKIQISLLIFAASLSYPQQYGILKGTVTNKENNQPLPSANVMIKGTLIGTHTDYNGNYAIRKIRPGKYTLVVSMIGFRKEEIKDVIIEAGKENILDINLEPTAVQVGQVVSRQASVSKVLQKFRHRLALLTRRLSNDVMQSQSMMHCGKLVALA